MAPTNAALRASSPMRATNNSSSVSADSGQCVSSHSAVRSANGECNVALFVREGCIVQG
jgi:hypothetical protein